MFCTTKKSVQVLQRMWYAIHLVIGLTSILHSAFTNDQSRMMIRLWKPDVFTIEDTVVCQKESVERFVKARILLEDEDSFSFVSMYNDEVSVFLCSRISTSMLYDREHRIQQCLWTSEKDVTIVFNSFKEWHASMFPDIILRIECV